MNMKSDRQSRITARLELCATILVIVVAGFVGGLTVWDRLNPKPAVATRPEPPLPTEPMSIDGAPVRGDRNAAVALIEFSDFECSYCARLVRDVLPEIDGRYVRTGKVMLVWRHYPVIIHDSARKAAEAAECARGQGKFWEFHDWAFLHQKELSDDGLRAAAQSLGLDVAAFGACLKGQASAKVQADVDLGNALSVAGTPTLFVGLVQSDGKVKVTGRVTGAKRYGELQTVIDKAIASRP